MLSVEDNALLTATSRGTTMGDFLRRFWVPFMLSEELPRPDCPPVRTRLMGEALVAFRDTSGRVGLLAERCPHRRASLFFGRNEEDGLRCVYHGWKFDVDGQCVDMPSEPATSNYKHKVRQTAYPTIEAGGVVWAYLGPTDRTPAMPDFSWLRVPLSHVHVTKRLERTNWVQALEGGIDSAHSNFLHTTVDTFRRTPAWLERAQAATDLRTRYHALDRSPVFLPEDTDYGLRVGARRDIGEGTHYWRFTHWMMPFYNLFRQGSLQPGMNSASIAWSPIDDHNCWTIVVTWNEERPLSGEDIEASHEFAGPAIPGSFLPTRNMENDYLIDRELQVSGTFTGITGIQAQDMAVQESMGSIVARFEEHLGTSDAAIIKMRRRLIRQARALADGADAPLASRDGSVYRVRMADTLVQEGEELDAAERERLCTPAAS
ncbi:MAG: Rieske 2Fe-2S domain-containing protein [Chloroflexota bacterium]|nr:Rieske 2Fe-2S domain-containing protein [Chloroflexota bacterium]MDE2884386.1 Rieske 2Fe-2S domain-containing protein [Chloroflexota bacterium]